MKNISLTFSGTTVTVSAILFDHDGTLVDTVPGLVAGHNAVAKHFNHPELTREDVVVRMASGGGLKIMGDLYGEERAEEALALFRQLVGGERKKNIVPMQGMERMVAKLGGLQVPMAIVSNANREMLDNEVGQLNLGKYFPVIVAADEAPRNKPAADPLFLALERLKLPKEMIAATLMVGDSEADLAAAKAAGCHAIFIHESGKAPAGYMPLAVFRSCDEFADFIEGSGIAAKPKASGPPLA